MNKNNIEIIIASGLSVLAFIAVLFTLYYTEIKDKTDYAKFHSDDIALFEDYNKYNTSTDDEDEYVIVSIKVKQANIQKADVAIRNYLSNVNGELLSEKELTGSRIAGILSGPVETNIIYTVKLPKEAKLADNLQESLNKYLGYLRNK